MAQAAAGRVYGTALAEAAQAAGRLHEVARDLSTIAEAVLQSREVSRVLFNPAFPHEAKKQILTQMSEGADPLVRNALLVLVDHKRLEELGDVVAIVQEADRRARRQLELELTTAVPIPDAEAEEIRTKLAAASGHEVTLERSVDSSIIGGVIVRVRDRMVDLSVRGRLEALRLSLRNARLGSTGGES
ncbi:MAG TPA: ATP synthase F1 subunit delta [Gaiellales bacterium]|jgi:ATP synthase F1 delta subunit|nr:ATP synthase F1 subunit delta [Gaiellales bacterium]